MYKNISSVYCRILSSQTKVINPIALRKAKLVYSFGLSSAIGLSKISSLRSAALVEKSYQGLNCISFLP